MSADDFVASNGTERARESLASAAGVPPSNVELSISEASLYLHARVWASARDAAREINTKLQALSAAQASTLLSLPVLSIQPALISRGASASPSPPRSPTLLLDLPSQGMNVPEQPAPTMTSIPLIVGGVLVLVAAGLVCLAARLRRKRRRNEQVQPVRGSRVQGKPVQGLPVAPGVLVDQLSAAPDDVGHDDGRSKVVPTVVPKTRHDAFPSPARPAPHMARPAGVPVVHGKQPKVKVTLGGTSSSSTTTQARRLHPTLKERSELHRAYKQNQFSPYSSPHGSPFSSPGTTPETSPDSTPDSTPREDSSPLSSPLNSPHAPPPPYHHHDHSSEHHPSSDHRHSSGYRSRTSCGHRHPSREHHSSGEHRARNEHRTGNKHRSASDTSAAAKLTALSQRKEALLTRISHIESCFEMEHGRPMDLSERSENAEWVETLQKLNQTQHKLKRLSMAAGDDEEGERRGSKSAPGREYAAAGSQRASRQASRQASRSAERSTTTSEPMALSSAKV